ncbi:MAG TPA: sulfatase-like hydrolase/transferase [Bacteroidales bacterium]|nr:sulfatase-like hydrolase/transferase [Bacteroidales bacterium]HQQ12463.1 sulfatase-like hydrolase/transferase [Bacteroidales bacterium]
MKFLTISTLKLALFWMIYFFLLRLAFVLFHLHLISLDGIGVQEVAAVFYHSLKLDLSTASYLVVLSFVLFSAYAATGKYIFLRLNQFFVGILILVNALITAAELGLYSEWKSKLSAKAISYLARPEEVFQTAGGGQTFQLIFIWVLLSLTGLWLFYHFFRPDARLIAAKSAKNLVAIIWLLPLLFFGARGGWAAIPVSVSSAYFSKHAILNAASLNSFYNITFSLLNAQRLDKENIFAVMPEDQARAIVRQIHAVEKDSTTKILKLDRPNIVVLLLESWSADLIESLGGEAGITPHFRELEKDGLLFTHFYANANRSQQAIGSLYAGLPGIPITTITDHPDKYASLPSFSKVLNGSGYETAFYFGGQLNYGNILSYLISNEIDVIVEGKDLPGDLPRGRLGVHDGIMLPFVAGQLDRLKEPFFTTVFTLSSHAPYDYPMEQLITWPKLEKEFVNGAHYTDKAIAAFFAEARGRKWFDNTLFIIMADHSKGTYRNHPLESFDYHKIPLLLCGPALKDSLKGKTFMPICGNTDLPATLLKQLNLSSESFSWSKNVFNAGYKPFAYFELNEGLGWIRPEGFFVWDKFADRYFQNTLPAPLQDSVVREGKAYLQVLYGDFLKY